MKISRKSFLSGLGLSALALAGTACGGSSASSEAASSTVQRDPITITVWTYYNGDQLETFNQLLDTFNSTVGRENGITVESSSQGNVNELESSVLDAANGKVGAAELPNIFLAYADTAYAIDQMGLIADLSPYFTEEERSAYLENYLSEGDFDGNGSIKIFPTAKSTELLFLNDTDWQTFADATGASYDDLATIEGLIDTAERYYNWTEQQTGTGVALFGRDSMGNYMILGAQQLGHNLFNVENGKMTLDFPEDVARKLWDSYYVPFIKGWFAATGRFRSDDIKTGNIIGYVGSSSSATYFPSQVMSSDTESHDIALKVLPNPRFKGGKAVTVQQGAGMAVTNHSEDAVEACVTFLKWFTAPENNIAFAVGSGYLPVTHAANDMDAIRSSGLVLTDTMDAILTGAVEATNTLELYTSKAFAGGADARNILTYCLSDLADADRATVLERVAAGQSAADAEAEFLTDEYFENWYTDLCDQLRVYEG